MPADPREDVYDPALAGMDAELEDAGVGEDLEALEVVNSVPGDKLVMDRVGERWVGVRVELREVEHAVKTALSLTGWKPQHRRIDDHVLARGQLHVEPHTELDEGGRHPRAIGTHVQDISEVAHA